MQRTSFIALASGAAVIGLSALGISPAGLVGLGSPMAGIANAASAAPAACPSRDIKLFVAAFAEDTAMQKAFTAETVDTAFVDYNAQPEPAEMVKPLPRTQLRFPVMPNRAHQAREGLRYRLISADANRAVVALEVPDTDAQMTYTFRHDRCWTLIKIVDPAFGKEFPTRARTLMAADDGNNAPKGLSKAFAECMARAGSQNTVRAKCLTAERDRQDARLNKVYQELIGNLQDNRRDRLVEAQRMWVQLRQKDGAFEVLILDELGPMSNLQSVENEARAISQRADQLEKYLELSRL